MAYLKEALGKARAGGGAVLASGAPSGGTDEVQTLTFGGTPDGGTFKLGFRGRVTAAISWSATNNTLRDNVDAALEALNNIGAGDVTTAVGTMTAGVGTLTVTFTGALAKKAVPLLTVEDNSLTGTDPTLEVEETTPGVDSTLRAAQIGTLYVNVADGDLYVKTAAHTWAVAGGQS
jgi:hypothetical protein